MRGQRSPVLLAHQGRHLLGLLRAEPRHGLAQESHQEVVASLHEPERELLLHAEVALGGPTGPGDGPARLHPQVAAVHQALEVVAGDVGVQGERGGDLVGGHARRAADVQEDVAPGRVTEGGRDGGDRGAEPAVGGVPDLHLAGSLVCDRDRSGAHGG
jgi:hypothetical protein